MSLEEEILGFVGDVPVTCFEIAERFGAGNHGLFAKPGCIIAYGLSKETSEAITKLLKEKKILILPCPPEIYEDFVLGIPLAGELRTFESDHWFPVVFMRTERWDDVLKGVKENNMDGVIIEKDALNYLPPDVKQWVDNSAKP